MTKVAHIIGNGKSAGLYTPSKGLKITCNLPPFEIANAYTTCMVDFKMMKAIADGVVTVPGDWTLGARPKKWMEMEPAFHMRYAAQIKEYHLDLPKYAINYTNFNCGHMATHYSAKKLAAEEIHMYGFDTLFAFDITSCTDAYMSSDRQINNTQRLTNNWRPVWQGIFKEFSNTQFVLYYHKEVDPLIKLPENVELRLGKRK